MRFLTLLAILLCSCASDNRPTAERFARQSWATVSVQQAEAECQHQIQTLSGLGSSFYTCMKAKGWLELE